jgi:quercetin dioxygenase-like cupin family protein
VTFYADAQEKHSIRGVVLIIQKKQLGKFKDERGILLWASPKLLNFNYKYLTIGSIEPGCKRGGHFHKETLEQFMCTGGKIRYSDGKENTVLEPGDIIDIPLNTAHTFTNEWDKTAFFIEFKGTEFDEKHPDTYKVEGK